MKINKECHKRLSTWINLLSLVTGAIMVYFPTIGLSQTTTGIVMTVCAVVTATCQAFTFKRGTTDVRDTES
jgi:hypothetical protein